MPWKQAFDVALVALPGWLWLALAVVSGLLLVACAIWLWRAVERTRRETRRQLVESGEVLARRTETLRWATGLADVGVWFWNLATGAVEWTDRCKTQFALARGRAVHDADGKPVSMGGVTVDVTDLRKIEDQLRALRVAATEHTPEAETARRFKLLAENAADVVMETDNSGVIRWITPSVRQRIGVAPEDVIDARFAQLVHPDEQDRVRMMENQVTQGAAAETRLRLRIADDGYQWFSVSLRPIFDDHQTVIGRVGGWRDIHREVQAQGVVAAERARLRATQEGMFDPLAIIEPVRDDECHVVDFTYIDVNPAACAWLGVDRDRLVGAMLRESVPEIESSGLLRQLAELADTGRPLVLDDFPFELHGSGLRRLDVRGFRGSGWVGLAWRDVSERHAALEKLAASEEQFRLLAENSTDIIMRLDAHDTILWASPSITSVLGWTAAACIGRDGKELLADAETRDQYARDKARVLAGQGAVSRGQIRAANGDIHWMEVHTFPYRTSEGLTSGMVASLHVVDTEVRMAQDLERRARMDELTGLLSRRELLERLAAAVAGREPAVGLVWCDIDGFKAINDTHGHAAGDAVLEALGARIRDCLRSSDDMGGRIGGDELIVVLRGIDGLDEAAAFAENLRRRAAEPIPVGDDVIRATISVGVTLAGPEEGVDALLARADDAMYQAKDHGKNRAVAIPPPAAVLAAGR